MKRQMIVLENLNCPSCAAKLEQAVKKLTGVKAARVAFGSGFLTVEYDDSVLLESVIREKIKHHGLGVATIVAG